MNRRVWIVRIAVLALCLGCAVPVRAHRLDEFLQATRLAVDLDRVTIEIDLTPGVRIAPQVLASIDTNRDGTIDAAEAGTYAQAVLNDVALTMDGRPAPVALIESRFPEPREIVVGIGLIRLRGVARLPPAGAGPHRIDYHNGHSPAIGAYLVNALVPHDRRIQIDRQRRDVAQRSIALDYRVVPDIAESSIWWLVAALTMTGGLAAARRFARQ
jgi:hypothetical protein